MARMSQEQKTADQLHAHLMRMDFDTARFAQYIHNCGIRMQIRVFNVFVSLVRHWAIDYDDDAWSRMPELATAADSEEYYNLLTYSKRIQTMLHL